MSLQQRVCWLVHDFGNVFEKVVAPAVLEDAETLLDSVLMFVRYYETNETFDLLTHGMGPRISGDSHA